MRGAVVNNSMAVMSFRRLVHLVVDDVGLRRTYSLRSIVTNLIKASPRPMREKKPNTRVAGPNWTK